MSTALIPNRMLFDLEFPLAYRSPKTAPKLTGKLDGWSDAERLPPLMRMDGEEEFADVYACWNEAGLYFACRVTGKTKALRCDPSAFWQGDNLRICTDMRDARSNKRATRTCQQFFFLPTGGGNSGKQPLAGAHKIQRARQDAPPIDKSLLVVASNVTKTGYTLEAHIPAECLSGFDPEEHPRIGLYYMLEDREHGPQYLTVGDDLYWFVDPSTWATAVLAKSARAVYCPG